MRRFGVFKALPPVRFKAAWHGGSWLPEGLAHRLPPRRLGECQVALAGGAEAQGLVWVGCSKEGHGHRLPRMLRALDVVGLEGWLAGAGPPDGSALFTDGDALELGLFLETLPLLALTMGRRLPSLRMAIGGSEPYRVGVTARLLAREVGELVMVGEWPLLPRVAGQILGESGLAARVKRRWPAGGWDLTIWCGLPPPKGYFDVVLFNPTKRLGAAPRFSWTVQGSAPPLYDEFASFAAAEAFLLTVGGGDRWGRTPFPFSLGWVGHVRALAKELGFHRLPGSLDTITPVGYNNY